MTKAEANSRIQEKIRSLLEMAAHPQTPEHERSLAQEQAEKLMNKYKVERASINWERPILQQDKPIRREFNIVNFIAPGAMSNSGRDFAEHSINGRISGLQRTVLQFAGARVTDKYFEEDGKYLRKWVVYGYEEDVFYGELLWNIVLQEVLRTMFPGWSDQRSMEENVYLLKKAGYSWSQIREIGLVNNAKDAYGQLTHANAGSKLRSAYGRAAKRRGEDPKAPLIRDPHWWRRSYADSFAVRLTQRMSAMKQERDEYFAKKNLPAIQKQESAVDEAFYEEFDFLRPPTPEEMERRRKEQEERDEAEKDKKSVRPAKAPRVRYYDNSAWNAGYDAANKIDLAQSRQFKNKEELQ